MSARAASTRRTAARRERGATAVASEPHGVSDRERAAIEIDVHAGVLMQQIRHVEPKVPRWTNLVPNMAHLLNIVQSGTAETGQPAQYVRFVTQ